MVSAPEERRNELRGAAKALSREIGAEALRALHREDRRLDILTIVVLWSLIALCFVLLGALPLGLPFLLVLCLQGFALLALGFCAHDLFIHRRVGGERLAPHLANLCLFPLGILGADYEASHRDHHWYLGTARDGESYKEDLDRRIWDLFGEDWAILWTDLTGFSRNVATFGITHFLQIIHEQIGRAHV